MAVLVQRATGPYDHHVASDEQLLDEFFRSATSTIEELVTKALHDGRPVWQLAIVLERRFDGEVMGGCGSRGAIASQIVRDARLPMSARHAIVNSIVGGALHEIPVVLLVHGEGYIAGGVRRVRGSLQVVS